MKIAAGLTHSVALTTVATGGAVYTWGGGSGGQQGNGYTTDRATPGSVLSGVKDIASGGGGSHTLALMNGGTVKCWGSNSQGQCGGYPTYTPVSTPIDAYAVSNVVAIGAGTGHSLAVKSDGTVFAWGEGFSSYGYQPGLISGLSGIKNVAAGSGFTLAVKTDGTVVGLGSNFYGGLGIGAVASASAPVALTSLGTVAVIAAGSNSTIAIRPNGNVFAWGSNSNGALGFGTATQKNVPIELLSENLVEVSSIAAGGNHNLISHADMSNHANDTVLAWGSNGSGELGANNLLPYAEPHLIPGVIPLFTSAPVAAAGIDFSLVLKVGGTVVAAGQNTYGQLGNAQSVSRSTAFIPISGLTNIASIGAGRWHALAVNSTGQVYAWGYGIYGQLGNGTSITSQYSPVAVGTLTNVSSVAAGQYHSVARKSDGTVWAWGYNANGQVGNTTSTDKKIPNQVGLPGAALTTVTSIAAGLSHNLARKGDGTVASWGYNANGQLGDNTTTQRTTPMTVPNLTGIIQVAAGYAHSLALKDDGTVWAWGRNVEGQLGDASNIQRNVPVQVVGLSGIIAIAAGDYHNLALKADGGVASWGANNLDQLGTGLSTAQLTPLIVPGINVLHGAPGVTIIPPNPDTYAMGEAFKLEVSLAPTVGNPVATVAYLNEGYPIPDAVSLGTETPPFSIMLALDTWGDFRISATAYDENETPSFPSPSVLIHIPPPITLTATQVFSDSVQLQWTPTLPNISTTFQVERRLPGEPPVIAASGVVGLNHLDAGLTFDPAYLYRVIGFTGTQKTALSREVSVILLDNDYDGLLDAWEIQYFGSSNAEGGGPNDDPDGDGLTNLQEFTYYADPLDFTNRTTNPLGDSDNNELPDWWEIQQFGHLGNNPNLPVVAKGGLTLKQIFDNDLDLTASSTIGDDIPDSWKIANGFNATDVNVMNQDADGDDLTNGEEFDAGTNPQSAGGWDTDGDGIPDGSDLSPLISDPSSAQNVRVVVPSVDEPQDPPQPDYTKVELRWDAALNGPSGYRVERRADSDVWQLLASVGAGTRTHSDDNLVANRHYEYRVTAVKDAGGQHLEAEAASAEYRVPLDIRLLVKRANLSRWKDGDTEFVNPSTPPKYYLVQTKTANFSIPPTPSPSGNSSLSTEQTLSLATTIIPAQHGLSEVGSFDEVEVYTDDWE